MFCLKHPCQKNKGFTVIELVIGIGLSSLLIVTIFSMLHFSNTVSTLGDSMDEIFLHGRFGIEYLKEEIRDVNKIISSDKITGLNDLFPSNIGFVLMKDTGVDSDERYNFSTYYLKDDELVRIARNKKLPLYPEAKDFSGYNGVCEGVLSLDDTFVDFENKLVELKISMGKNNKEFHCFKSTLFIDSEYDY